MIVERHTIPHLNALVGGTKILEEQLCSSFRGCHATSPLKSVFFTRKVAWQSLIEVHSWAWDILTQTSRAKNQVSFVHVAQGGNRFDTIKLDLRALEYYILRFPICHMNVDWRFDPLSPPTTPFLELLEPLVPPVFPPINVGIVKQGGIMSLFMYLTEIISARYANKLCNLHGPKRVP